MQVFERKIVEFLYFWKDSTRLSGKHMICFYPDDGIGLEGPIW